jgi:hypothetical protein
MIAALVIALCLAGLTLAYWRAPNLTTRNRASLSAASLPQQSSPAPALSKEYIYAGGRLVATEEPAGSGSNNNPGYNPVSDFSATQNPNGVWSYGAKAAPGSALSLYTVHSNAYGTGMETWSMNGSCCSMITRNNTGSTQTYANAPSVVQYVEALNLHPGPSSERSVLRWTAPIAGTFKLEGRFQGLDTAGTTTDVTISQNGTVFFTGGINGYGNQATFSETRTVAAGETIDFQVGDGDNSYGNDSTGLSVTITAQPARINYALASNGGVASASSTTPDTQSPGYEFHTTAANDGDRAGHSYPHNAFWRDDTSDAYPDWLQIDFSGSKTIDEIDLFSVQDGIEGNVTEPTETQTFSLYGLTAFDIQYWNGSGWATVPNGSVTGNNKVWKKLTFPELSTTKIRVMVNGALYGRSRMVELEAYGTGLPTRMNVALAANGATAGASSTLGAGWPAAGAINGDRKGLNWGEGGGWADGTANAYPDWLEVDFSGTKSITEIDVFTVQNDYQNPVEPTQTMMATTWGLLDFEVQYWTGSVWAGVPNASVTNNDKTWRKFAFPVITTGKIRVYVTNSRPSNSRITELEAYQ